MGVKLADKLEQMNGQNYPLIDASAVEYKKQDGTTIRIDEALNSIESGGSLDLTNYQQKTDNTLNTTDKTIVGAINEVNRNVGIMINDDEPTEETVYSGVKIERDFASRILLANMIHDDMVNGVKTYSSYKIERDFQQKTDNTLNTTDKTIVGAINEVKTSVVGITVPTKVSELDNDSGFLTEHQDLTDYAKTTDLHDHDNKDVLDLLTESVDGKLQYNGTAISGTDELVKMDITGDAHYLADLLDKQTIINDNGTLKVKKLDGQEVTIAEINNLKGLTMNVMDLVNMFSNGGVKVLNTPVATYADLTTLDRSTFLEGISYIVYVLADETHAGAKTTYLCDKTSSTYFGNADSQRNFTTNPIDLANEVTGKLKTDNIDVDSLWALLTIDNTYKTLTTTNNAFSTHGAKAMYDELTTAIGAKANAVDLTAHTDDTNIHVTTTDKEKWDKVVDKVDKADISTTIDSTSTNDKAAGAKAVYDIVPFKFGIDENGNYGYYKAGADTVTPFKSSVELEDTGKIYGKYSRIKLMKMGNLRYFDAVNGQNIEAEMNNIVLDEEDRPLSNTTIKGEFTNNGRDWINGTLVIGTDGKLTLSMPNHYFSFALCHWIAKS